MPYLETLPRWIFFGARWMPMGFSRMARKVEWVPAWRVCMLCCGASVARWGAARRPSKGQSLMFGLFDRNALVLVRAATMRLDEASPLLCPDWQPPALLDRDG